MTNQSNGTEIANLFAYISADVQEYAASLPVDDRDLAMQQIAAAGISVAAIDKTLTGVQLLIEDLQDSREQADMEG